MKAVLLASILLPCLSFAMASQAGWEVYRAEKYGFEMLVPKGTHLEEHEWKDGFGGLYAKNGAIELYGMAQIKSDATAEEIEAYGVEVSGISEDHWEKIDEGKGNGWSSYRTYKAQNGNNVVYAGLGAGPKGSYLLMLKTTADDVAKHEADYKKWYASLKLF
jgi:hypothetical protein